MRVCKVDVCSVEMECEWCVQSSVVREACVHDIYNYQLFKMLVHW